MNIIKYVAKWRLSQVFFSERRLTGEFGLREHSFFLLRLSWLCWLRVTEKFYCWCTCVKDILNIDIYLCAKTLIIQFHHEIQISIIQFIMQLWNDIYSVYIHLYTHTHIYIHTWKWHFFILPKWTFQTKGVISFIRTQVRPSHTQWY